jgi:hypothetical protein
MHKQEIRQKIGNSLAVIIFNDSSEPFDPSNLFLGEWNVIVCVVQCDVLQSPGDHLSMAYNLTNATQSQSCGQANTLKNSSSGVSSQSGHPPSIPTAPNAASHASSSTSTSGTICLESPRRVGSTSGLASVGFSSALPVVQRSSAEAISASSTVNTNASNTLGTTPPNDSLSSHSPGISRSTSRDSLARVGKGPSREHIKVNARAAFNDTDRAQKHRISRQKDREGAKEPKPEQEISSPPITPRSEPVGASSEHVPSLNFSGIRSERSFFPDDDTMEGVEHTPPSSVHQTPRTPHQAPMFESEMATVASPDCIYRCAFAFFFFQNIVGLFNASFGFGFGYGFGLVWFGYIFGFVLVFGFAFELVLVLFLVLVLSYFFLVDDAYSVGSAFSSITSRRFTRHWIKRSRKSSSLKSRRL